MVSGIKVDILILILRLASPLCFQNFTLLLNKVKFNAWGYQSVSCDVETVSFWRSVPNIRQCVIFLYGGCHIVSLGCTCRILRSVSWQLPRATYGLSG